MGKNVREISEMFEAAFGEQCGKHMFLCGFHIQK
jgi:hypothetical protein